VRHGCDNGVAHFHKASIAKGMVASLSEDGTAKLVGAAMGKDEDKGRSTGG
jgi:hypothetical protein